MKAHTSGFAAFQSIRQSQRRLLSLETPFCSEIVVCQEPIRWATACVAYFEIHRVLFRSVERAVEKSGACTPFTVSNLFVLVSTGVRGCQR